ncbi:hypothetical protein AAU61_00035 [Desulfocarbo indianensis]|nr:hypothetical protein AAU61_00035 [Desulfocarbo indianensis]
MHLVANTVKLVSLHPMQEMSRRALKESADYIQKNMPKALGMQMRQDILEYALAQVKIKGHYLELGVYKGDSLKFIANQVGDIHVHGFDSFEGLPSDWSGANIKKERFDIKGKLPKMPSNVTLYPGWFSDTIPLWGNNYEGNIAFMHVDSDVYSSAKDIFIQLGNRIVNGTIIVFDEYFNYPNWQHHEYRAFKEFVCDNNITYEYIAYAYEQVAVRILGE